MKRLLALTVLAAMGCRGGAPFHRTEDVIPLPGTQKTFTLTSLPGAPFRIAVHEVTWAEIDRFRTAEKLVDEVGDMLRWSLTSESPRGLGDPDRPAVGLGWHTAVAYCDWLSRNTGHYFRLPTEAEWEYALHDNGESPDDVAWHRGNSGDRSHPPGGKKPNGFGIYDLLGNAWEYMLEWQEPPAFGPVLRGGAWDTAASDLARRRQLIPEDWNETDPTRPHSLWWHLRFSPSAGMRVVAVAGPEDREERTTYRARIEVRILKATLVGGLKIGSGRFRHYRVDAEARNGGDRSVDDLEIEIHSLTPDGKPHRKDLSTLTGAYGRPAWTKAWPVLCGRDRPLAAGEARRFTARVPESIDDEDVVDPGRFGAVATNLRFHRK